MTEKGGCTSIRAWASKWMNRVYWAYPSSFCPNTKKNSTHSRDDSRRGVSVYLLTFWLLLFSSIISTLVEDAHFLAIYQNFLWLSIWNLVYSFPMGPIGCRFIVVSWLFHWDHKDQIWCSDLSTETCLRSGQIAIDLGVSTLNFGVTAWKKGQKSLSAPWLQDYLSTWNVV